MINCKLISAYNNLVILIGYGRYKLINFDDIKSKRFKLNNSKNDGLIYSAWAQHIVSIFLHRSQ